MQQEEVDRKAIMAERGPGVHSSFTLLLRTLSVSDSLSPPCLSSSLFLSFTLFLTHTENSSCNQILSNSCSSSVPSELLLSTQPSRLKETVHLNVHNLLSKANSWSHCSPVASQRARDREKRFYPGRIQWHGQKQAGKSEVRASGIWTFILRRFYCQHLFSSFFFIASVACMRTEAVLCI